MTQLIEMRKLVFNFLNHDCHHDFCKVLSISIKICKTEIMNIKQTRVGFNRPMTQHVNILPNNKNATPSKIALDTDSHSA
jgi:hypothetical protein